MIDDPAGGAEPEVEPGSGDQDLDDLANVEEVAGNPPRGGRRRLLVKLGVASFLLIWLSLVVVLGLRTRSSLVRGIDRLETARTGLTVESLIQGDQLPELRAASADFDDAARSSNHWLFTPLRVVPWLGRQIRSVQSLTDSASALADLGVDASERMSSVIGDGSIPPGRRAAVATELGLIADEATRTLDDLDLGPPNDLVRPLQAGRDDVARSIASLRTTLVDVGVGATGVARFLDGPSRYLLLAAHNGEMRSGTGMFLSAGVVSVADGGFDVADMSSTTDLRLPPGAVALPTDLDALWGWAGPGQEWRNLAMSPDFPVTASLATEMWRARTGETLDGVMVVDVAALQGLVNVLGSVQLSDQTLTKDNVTNFLMVEQYRDILLGQEFEAKTGARRDRLKELAQAAVSGLDDSDWEISQMIDVVLTAIRGRHILLWSNRADEQASWAAAGADGALAANSMMVSLISQGGTKVDQWIDVRPVVRRAPTKSGVDEVTVTVTLTNNTPNGLPWYVSGPSRREDSNAGVEEGAYAGIVSLTLPGAAAGVRMVGDPELVAGSDGPTQVIARRITLQRGESGTVVVQFALPRGVPLEVLPSAKLPTTLWDVDGVAVAEDRVALVGECDSCVNVSD